LPQIGHVGSVVGVAVDGEFVGALVVADRLSMFSQAVRTEKTGLGDRDAVGDNVEQAIAERAHRARFRRCCRRTARGDSRGEKIVAMVGDGVNGTPLARTDVRTGVRAEPTRGDGSRRHHADAGRLRSVAPSIALARRCKTSGKTSFFRASQRAGHPIAAGHLYPSPDGCCRLWRAARYGAFSVSV